MSRRVLEDSLQPGEELALRTSLEPRQLLLSDQERFLDQVRSPSFRSKFRWKLARGDQHQVVAACFQQSPDLIQLPRLGPGDEAIPFSLARSDRSRGKVGRVRRHGKTLLLLWTGFRTTPWPTGRESTHEASYPPQMRLATSVSVFPLLCKGKRKGRVRARRAQPRKGVLMALTRRRIRAICNGFCNISPCRNTWGNWTCARHGWLRTRSSWGCSPGR